MIARLHPVTANTGRFSNTVNLATKLFFFLGMGLIVMSLSGCNDSLRGMLDPKGIVAFEERKLFFDALALMLIVVLPVIVMSIVFAFHYRASHRTSDYKPNWSHNHFLESIWWTIPCIIIVILAILTWKKTLELDPFHKIAGHDEAPLQIQVIALPWKWLFIYPEQQIASVNYLVLPVEKQVEFFITTDNVPMSAFFIPQLGSQIYTMTGMESRLHLVANQVGTYDGMNTQFNGDGFSDMHFPVYVTSPDKMQTWVNETKKSPQHLTEATYHQLLIPTTVNPPQFFSGIPKDLFQEVMMTYMHSSGALHPRNQNGELDHSVKMALTKTPCHVSNKQ